MEKMKTAKVSACFLIACAFVVTAKVLAIQSCNKIQNISNEMEDDLAYQLAQYLRKRLKPMRNDSSTDQSGAGGTKGIYSFAGTITPSFLYPCDNYLDDKETCVFFRQVGTSITFGVDIKRELNPRKIRWYRSYYLNDGEKTKTRELAKGRLPWNIALGGEYNNELRITPVSYTDMDFNSFHAKADEAPGTDTSEQNNEDAGFITFRVIQIITDIGYVYPGEELIVNVRQFIDLPLKGLTFQWSMRDLEPTNVTVTSHDEDLDSSNLPSNMKISRDGSTVHVKELKSQKDHILACSMYSQNHVFVARKGFLLRNTDDPLNITSILKPNIQSGPYTLKRLKRSLLKGQESRALYSYQNRDNDKDVIYHEVKVQPGYQFTTESTGNALLPQSNSDEHYKYIILGFRLSRKTRNTRNDAENVNYGEILPIHSSLFYSNPRSRVGMLHPEVKTFVARPEEKDFTGSGIDMAQFRDPRIEVPPAQNGYRHDLTYENFRNPVFDEEESLLINLCRHDVECSRFAKCIHQGSSSSFCKCQGPYKGNGIFCWLQN